MAPSQDGAIDFGRSAHLLGELFAAENMKVQMLYRLAAVLTAVGEHAVSVGKPLLLCDRGDRLKDPCHNSAVLGADADELYLGIYLLQAP